jgi:phenylacetic acid degradation protein
LRRSGASLRGDFDRLILEPGSSIQDNCVMHGFPGKDCAIEAAGHVGHGAILHGCRVGRNALIGMNAVIMDGPQSARTASWLRLRSCKPVSRCRRARWWAEFRRASCARCHLRDRVEEPGHRRVSGAGRRCPATLECVEPLTAREPDRRAST